MRADASLGYAHAAIDLTSAAVSTGLTLTALSFDCWGRTAEAFSRAPAARRTWYTKPSSPSLVDPAAIMPWVNPLAHFGPYGTRAWIGSAEHFSPMRLGAAWLDLFPLRGPPAAWPLAYLMLAYGVPRSVAMPAAEANAAAIEAVDAAMKPLRAFASYRSDGGHAATILMSLGPAAFFAMSAMDAMSAAPISWS